MSTILHFWKYILAKGAHYGVNPTVFAVLYIIHHPLFWGTVTWIVIRARKKLMVWPHCVVAAAFWLMPYTYVAFSMKNVPWYAEVGVGVVFLYGAYRAFLEVRKKISETAENAEPHDPKTKVAASPLPAQPDGG
jgi:hypothetical protein